MGGGVQVRKIKGGTQLKTRKSENTGIKLIKNQNRRKNTFFIGLVFR